MRPNETLLTLQKRILRTDEMDSSDTCYRILIQRILGERIPRPILTDRVDRHPLPGCRHREIDRLTTPTTRRLLLAILRRHHDHLSAVRRNTRRARHNLNGSRTPSIGRQYTRPETSSATHTRPWRHRYTAPSPQPAGNPSPTPHVCSHAHTRERRLALIRAAITRHPPSTTSESTSSSTVPATRAPSAPRPRPLPAKLPA